MSKMMNKIGTWAFIIGIIIALIVGLYQAYLMENNSTTDIGGYIAWILAILGAIVGILAAMGKGTITKSETSGFLIAGIALVVMYGVFRGMLLKPWIGSLLQGVSWSLSVFVAPAVGILAIKSIWDMGKDQ
jgi:nucleoside recognition membrane protein YjiH